MQTGNPEETIPVSAVTFRGLCYRCGGQGHMVSTFRFCNVKCHFCQKLGHIAKYVDLNRRQT